MCVILKSICGGFSLRGCRVTSWLSFGWGREACGQFYGSSTVLTRQYLAYNCYCTYVVQTPSMERRIFVEQIRPTVALEPREGDHSLI